MRGRTFAFLTCVGCRRFLPKRLAQDALLVGFCADAAGLMPVQWRSLEHAAAGSCADRDPLPAPAPRCAHFEVTTESAGRPYPESCVHHNTAVCPLPL